MNHNVPSPSDGRPLSLLMWVAQLLITIVFATGFITYYLRAWHLAFERFQNRPVVSWIIRIGMLVVSIAVGIGLHMIGWLVFTDATGLMFHNLGLFVLSFTLLDEGATWWIYLIQLASVVSVWLMHHMGYYSDPKFSVSLVCLGIAAVIMWVYRDRIRYNIAANIAIYTFIGLSFWALLPRQSAGLTMTPMIALQAFTMYMCMVVVTVLFKYADHQANVRNQLNDQTAHFDALTNAKSYATFKEEVNDAFADAEQKQGAMAMVAVDIDYFKQINDHYGHLAGDDILVGIANTLRSVLAQYPGNHGLYRTGGEEFTIVFSGDDSKVAQPIVEDCWRTVRERRFDAGSNQVRITISMGVADIAGSDKSIEDLYKRADASLYQSKHEGRDTITLNGKTIDGNPERRPIAIRTLLTQRVMDTETNPAQATHDEVILANYEDAFDRWDFPGRLDVPLSVQLKYVVSVLHADSTGRIIINLTDHQFFDAETPKRLAAFKAMYPQLKELVVELNDVPDTGRLAEVAPIYHQNNLAIDLEQFNPVGSSALISAVLPFIDGIKFNVKDLRRARDDGGTKPTIDFDKQLTRFNVSVVVNGIENSNDAEYAQKVLHARYVQGYFYDRPQLPRFA